MHRVSLFALVSLSSLFWLSQAQADDFNRLLRGDYAERMTRTCSRTAAGFGADLQLLGPAVSQTASTELTITYNGDGTSTAVGRVLNLTNGATATGNLPVSASEFTCTGTYQVDEDRSFTEVMSCSGSVLAGASAGQTFSEADYRVSGQIGPHGAMLVVGNTDPQVESITLSASGTTSRICARTGTAVKIRKKSDSQE